MPRSDFLLFQIKFEKVRSHSVALLICIFSNIILIIEMRKFFKSFYYALKGIYLAFKDQQNIKVQMVIGIIVLIWGIIIRLSVSGMAIIIFVSFFVIILEMVNTAIEKFIDKISTKYNRDFGKIKDIMAGAVLLAAILSVILGIMIMLPPTLKFFDL